MHATVSHAYVGGSVICNVSRSLAISIGEGSVPIENGRSITATTISSITSGPSRRGLSFAAFSRLISIDGQLDESPYYRNPRVLTAP